MIGIANADLPLLFNAQVLENLKNVLVLLMSMVHKVNWRAVACLEAKFLFFFLSYYLGFPSHAEGEF